MTDDSVEEQRDNNVGGITGKGFKPGRSGNPNGRPAGRSITARIREILDASELGGKSLGKKQAADLLAEVVVKGALKGDVKLISLVIDRLDGKVPETIHIEHRDLNEAEQFQHRLACLAARVREGGVSLSSDDQGTGAT